MPAADARPARAGLSLPFLAALFGYAFGLFAPQFLNDGDIYMHIAAGEWILRHGTVPHADPFSHTFAGAPWIAHEWLAQVAMALAYRAAAWNGIVMLSGAATALTLGLLAHHLRRWLDLLPALAVLALAALCMRPSLLARPHLLALPILELWAAGLVLARARGRPPSPWLLPLMPLWANLHGGFVFGLALIGPLALDALIEAKPGERLRVVRGWGLFAAAAAGLALATPHGWHGLLFPFQVTGLTFLSRIDEWKATSFEHLQPIELALMALLAVAFTRSLRLSPARLLTLLGLLHLALQHYRHQQLAGLVGALLLAEPLGRALARPPALPRARHAAPRLVAAAAIALAFAATALRAAMPVVREDDRISPIAALAHVPPALAREPVLNERRFGGYLIFAHVRTFVDGRADMYGDPFLWAYDAIAKGDEAAFAAAVERYGIRWTILAPENQAVAMLDALPGWRRLYADDVAVVHVRTDPEAGDAARPQLFGPRSIE